VDVRFIAYNKNPDNSLLCLHVGLGCGFYLALHRMPTTPSGYHGLHEGVAWIPLYWDKLLVECIDRAHTRASMVHTLSARFPSCAALPAVSSGLRVSGSSRC
jgi:hypothetical protein